MRIPESLEWKSTGRTLGSGGQATVVEVKRASGSNEQTYALKALSKGKPQKAYERFGREIEAVQRLSHPGIVRILDYSLSEDFPYYVMEFVPGARSLKKALEQKANPFYARPTAALRFFRQLVEVIAACEEVKVIHRDFSPANVLILPDETIRVIDFGLCQIADAVSVTLQDEGIGTQNYMAPECEAGAETAITSAADLYSAGKLLWSAITGLFAFAREAPAFQAKSMKSIFPGHSAAWHIQHIFARTIRHNVTDRWKNAGEALRGSAQIEFLIDARYPPLELLNNRSCPMCGLGELKGFDGSHMVFGNPGLQGIEKLQCTVCGWCFPVNWSRLRKSIEQLENLQ